MIDEAYFAYATPKQETYLRAFNEYGTYRKAAKKLGVHNRRIGEAVEAVKRKAALAGFSPEHDMVHTTPEPYIVKGTSTYYDEMGNIRGQWVKTQVKEEALVQRVRDALGGLTEEIRGMADPTPAPVYRNDDILAVYPMGDPHFGMYAWAAETGDDFDIDIAEQLTCAAIDRLVMAGGGASEAMLINLGDFFHADDSKNMTPGHGNILDVDTRYGKVLQVGMRAMVYCVKRLLTVHDKVTVWNMPGNHDPHAAWALAIGLQAYFDREPRVQIDLPQNSYNYRRFGKNLIGAHHGDGAKAQDLPLIMASDRKEDWGQTDYRVFHCGHIHHLTRKEYPGVVVETHRTLAGRDAWHSHKGYRSGRDMNVILYHKDWGEIQRTRCDFAVIQNVVH